MKLKLPHNCKSHKLAGSNHKLIEFCCFRWSLICSISIFTGSSGYKIKCLDGWSGFSESQSCYKFIDHETNFLDAKMSCESRGSSLAIIDTKAGQVKLCIKQDHQNPPIAISGQNYCQFQQSLPSTPKSQNSCQLQMIKLMLVANKGQAKGKRFLSNTIQPFMFEHFSTLRAIQL